ncbi:protein DETOXIFICATION 44, chloroplastic isoform X1 [Quercus robur]|uniref:protein DETOXIFICATION 44, chloroplastic isoform X1 n=1 Tax=Quercus robur TaxID=38942 RepID=UPI002162222E|nr:protein DETOXIFICATION 44, chloroplastic isoform X1 [Quercus robur]
MASTLTRHHLLCLYSPKPNPSSFKSQSPIRNPNFSFRLRTTVLKSSPQKRVSTPIETPPQDLKPAETPPPRVDPVPPSFSSRLRRLRDGIKFDELALEILSIALPAALALAADPIASLVDSAFVGHLGSVELAAVGVSVSVFNLVSKLFNVPLLNITTSFVAEEQALISKAAKDSEMDKDRAGEHKGKVLLPSVSTSLALAASIGIAEAVALSFGSGFLMNIMGIPADSPMRVPAEQFLTWRAFGAPPIVIALAAQGTFRGFKDTKTPLYAIGAGNLLNALLDPILIFLFGIGIGGAAIATVISEYLIAFILLWELNGKVLLISPNIDGRKVASYLKSGGLLIGRTLAVLVTMTLATSMAAREGPIPMAGHQICIQVWLAVSLLTDALALAGQALLASGYSQGNYEQSRQVIYRVLQIGLVSGTALAVILFLGFGAFSSLFTTDLEVLTIAWSGILFVAGSQPMNALAFVLDGLYYGVSDFGYAAYSMVLVGLISSMYLLVAAPAFGLAGVWSGLFLFMTLRVVAGIWRLGSKSGPWKMVWSEMKQESE